MRVLVWVALLLGMVAVVPVRAQRVDGVYRLSPAKLVQAKRLHARHWAMYWVNEAWSMGALLLLLNTGAVRWLRERAEQMTKWRWLQGVFVISVLLLWLLLLRLPLSIYGHHVELIFGRSVQRWGSWAQDKAVGYALDAVVYSAVAIFVYWLMRRMDRRWWMGFWLATVPTTVVLVFVAPLVIDPLFDHFEPLQAGHPELVRSIEILADHAGMKIDASHMVLMQASAKYTGINAYVTGVGSSKRIVVWDTAVTKSKSDELLLVLGHEMGHYALNHIWWGIAFTLLLLLLLLPWVSAAERWLIARLGGRWGVNGVDDWAAVAVLLLIVMMMEFALSPVSSGFSRMLEHNADVYGQEAVHGVVGDPQEVGARSFQELGELSLDDPTPHPFEEWWLGSHPSITERKAFAASYDPWAAGAEPRYFRKEK